MKPALLFLLILAVGCHPKTTRPPVKLSPPDIAQPTEISYPNEQNMNVRCIASFRKTACFGQCPVFEMKVFSDGHATYFGEFYAPRHGNFAATLKKNWLKNLFQSAESYGYWGLEKYYPTSRQIILDLPTTHTFVEYQGKILTIENHFDAPLALREFEKYFEKKIEELDWSPIQ